MSAPTGGGPVAQSVEHLTFNQMVAGSIPAGLTTFPDGAGQGVRPDVGARPEWPKRRLPGKLPGSRANNIFCDSSPKMFLRETARQ